MAKHDGSTPEQPTRPRPVIAAGQYGAPGDEPLSTPEVLTLDESFRFDRGLAKRLRMR
jgi:hypothetical protein